MTEETTLGSKLRTLRESLGLTEAELAERCSCEESTIKDLESDSLAPSLAPLIKITRALGVRLGTLLDDDKQLGPVVTYAGEAEETIRIKNLSTSSDAGKLDFTSLAEGKTSRHMEPFYITAHPSSTAEHKLSSHEGEEFLYVLEGALEIEYGNELYTLGVGDSIYYDSIVPHQVRAHGEESARFIATVYTPL